MATKEATSSTEVGKKSFLDFCTQNSKKFVLAAVIVAGAALAAGGGLLSFYRSPIAVINGEKITRQNYNDMKDRLTKSFQYSEDKDSLKNITQITVDKLVEDKIVETEAQKRGISVSEEAVNAEYQNLIKVYGSEDKFKATIENAFNWTPELTKQTIRNRLLKAELEKVVLSGYDFEGIFIRYDGLNSDQLKKDALARITLALNNVKNGSTFNKEAATMQNETAFKYSTSGYRKSTNINDSNWNSYFVSKEPWEGIKKVKSANSYTEIIDTPANEYSVYKITKISNGSYATWDEYVNSFKQQKLSLRDEVANILVPTAYAHTYPGVSSDATSCPPNIGTTNTTHNCCVPLSTHLTHTNVTIYNYLTGTAAGKLDGRVTATDNGFPAGHLCRNSQHDGNNWPALPQTLTAWSTDVYNHTAVLGGTSNTMTCAYHWDINLDYSEPGLAFYKAQYHDWDSTTGTVLKETFSNPVKDMKIDNGSIGVVDFYVVPAITVTVKIHGNGKTTGAVNCDGDGSVCVESLLQIKSTSSDHLDMTADTNWEYSKVLATSPGVSSTYTSNPFNFNLDRNWTFDVYFTQTPPPPPEPTPTLSCSATPATGEAPLAVRVTFTSDDGTSAHNKLTNITVLADKNGNDITSYSNILSPIVFTYSKEGTYSPAVKQASVKGDDGVLGHAIACQNVPITVINPANPNGGEKPPTN